MKLEAIPFLIIIALVAGIYFSEYGDFFRQWIRRSASEEWKLVACDHVEGKAEARGKFKCRLNAGYSFEVDGHRYGGTYVSDFTTLDQAEEHLRYLKSKPMPVRYNPADPWQNRFNPEDMGYGN